MDCWSVAPSSFRTPLIITDIHLFNPNSQEFIPFGSIMIDTGYDGDILLDYLTYRQFGFHRFEYDPIFSAIAETVERVPIRLISAPSKARWGTKEFDIDIDTFEGNPETLLGRGLFLKVSSLFNAKTQQFCLEEK